RGDELLLLHQAEAHRVDDRISFITAIEHDLAADVRDPDAVAVVAHPADDAAEQVPHARRGEVAEAERVEHRDRTRAHREDVPQDATHPGRGALVRLDGGRVVVRLDLEGERVPVADLDDTRI